MSFGGNWLPSAGRINLPMICQSTPLVNQLPCSLSAETLWYTGYSPEPQLLAKAAGFHSLPSFSAVATMSSQARRMSSLLTAVWDATKRKAYSPLSFVCVRYTFPVLLIA